MLYKTKKKNREVLSLFYFFSIVTLLFRDVLYFFVLFQSDNSEDNCIGFPTWITFEELPDYLYLIVGACQLFIIIELLIVWKYTL